MARILVGVSPVLFAGCLTDAAPLVPLDTSVPPLRLVEQGPFPVDMPFVAAAAGSESLDVGEWPRGQIVYERRRTLEETKEDEVPLVEVVGGFVDVPANVDSLTIVIGHGSTPPYLEIRTFEVDPRGRDAVPGDETWVCSHPRSPTDADLRDSILIDDRTETVSLEVPLGPDSQWLTIYAAWTGGGAGGIEELAGAWLFAFDRE